MLNFNEFREEVKRRIMEDLKDFHIVEIRETNVSKNNGLNLHGISPVIEGTNITPNIYLDKIYEMYTETGDLESNISRIENVLAESIKNVPSETLNIAKDFVKTDFVKNKIVMKLINAKNNEEFLKTHPHDNVMDLAIIYKVRLSNEASITITNEHLKNWDFDESKLYEIARENMKTLMPAQIISMDELLTHNQDLPEELKEAMDNTPNENKQWVVTNEQRFDGAVNILFSENLEKLANIIKHDFYILPSSVHEVICINENLGDPEAVNQMVREVNATESSPEEVLANHIYKYSLETKTIESIE